jgi:hypothetical protein
VIVLVDVQTVGVLVTAASVSVAAIYYIFTLRTNQKNLKMNLETRQAQLFMQMYTTHELRVQVEVERYHARLGMEKLRRL